MTRPIRPGKGQRSGLEGPDTQEMHAMFPDFTAGAEAVLDDSMSPTPDPVILDAYIVAARAARGALTPWDAALLATTHREDAVIRLTDILAAVAWALKGPPPEPTPLDWWDDLPDRAEAVAARLRQLESRQPRSTPDVRMATKLSLVEVEARKAEYRKQGEAAVAANLRQVADALIAQMLEGHTTTYEATRAFIKLITPEDPTCP